MTEIINGVYQVNETSKNAMGGTEQMALRIVKNLPQNLLQGVQIIHSRVRDLVPNVKKILVLHDLANDPEVQKLKDPRYRQNFDKIVFVSNWQAQQYIDRFGIQYKEFEVIRNAIEPFEQFPEKSNDVVRLIYHTTPHRGLTFLFLAFVDLLEKYPNIELDVFSSFEVYGWGERDKQFEDLFNHLRNHPKIRYHGAQSNAVVRETLKDTHIFAYPCIWQETSCIAAIEAMCAANVVVHSNFGALSETCGYLQQSFQLDENGEIFLTNFKNVLGKTIERIQSSVDLTVAKTNWAHYNSIYRWDAVQPAWENLLRRLKDDED